MMTEVKDDVADAYNESLDSIEAAIEYASDELVEFGQELRTEAQRLIDEALESGAEQAKETWQDVVETIDKIEKSAIAANALVQATAEEFAQAVENMVDRAQEVTEQIEQLGDSVAGMVVKTYLELAKRADELGDEAGEWVDSSIEKLVRIANDFGDYLTEEGSNLVNDIKATISDLFNNAQSAILRRDPLTLDLDGDGLETVGINSAKPILFDHTGDGIKTATGWIKPDDGFLVLDRNGNGTIDNGTELFGDSTPLFDADGQVIGKAEDGFAALAQEDTNGDGVVNAQDANFNDLRIWRDLNSDGISQEGELQSLTEAGITAINVAKTENSQPLANGNLLADLGSYVRSDGSEGGVGSVSAELGDIDLAEDTFHSEFADSIPLTEEAQALPDMNGSGQVRSLREAASLSPEVAAILDQYAQATTRSAQLALLDQLIVAWGETSGLAVTGDGAYDGAETSVSIAGYAEGSAGYEAWMTKLQTLERFNGRPFATPAEGAESVSINLFGARQSFLNQSWSALRQSVYDGLLQQTRLKPYLDAIALTVNDSGLAIDFTGTAAAFADRHASAPGEAVRDLLDLQRISGTDLNGMGWDGYGQLRGWLADTVVSTDPTLNATLIAALGDFGYPGLQTDGSGTNASEAVIGDDAGATLNGEGGNDLLLGGDSNDTLNGGSGNDVLYGGTGDDTYRFNLGDDNDTIVESAGNSGSDTLEFGPDILAGDISISVEGDKLVFAHSNGQDRVSVANWFNSLDDSAHRLDTVLFADGSSFDLNTLQLGTTESDTLTGTDGNDILIGDAGDDTLDGGNGNDWIDGGSGADQMTGGDGDDIYVVDNSGDVVTEAVDGGIDTVDSKISTTLSDNVENLRLAGVAGISGTGNELDNTISGNAGNNALYGMVGDDTLLGNAGNDTLDGGVGADTMAGGSGDDTYLVDDVNDSVSEAAGEGNDTVQSDIDYTLGENVENLTLTGAENLTGTGNSLNNVITGNAGDNTLSGFAGNDTLNGGAGSDTMMGGTGNDTYVVESDGDTVVEALNEGIDTVESSITRSLSDNVENLTLTGSANIDGIGNELDNVITGNTGSNTLDGLEGNDTLDGGAGADTMSGGTGNDTYIVDNAGDTVIEAESEGIDTVRSSVTRTLSDNVENLTLTGGLAINATGNELDNVLVGNNAANVLDGGVGADHMAGSYGNDTYILDDAGDTVSELYGQGTDTVVAPFDYTLGDNVENLNLTGTALTGTGNSLNNVITGTDADNLLTGLDGNDTLNGGVGSDTMVGGRGDDTFVVESDGDTVVEAAGEGIDTVQSSITRTLSDNVDNLTLTGTEDIDGTGNELNNVIIGNTGTNTLTGLEGDDTLDGGTGADAMSGGIGNDTYVVDNAGDDVIEAAGEGTDIVKASIDYTLTDNVENLTLTGNSAIDGTGNELDNVILGNSSSNTLTGLDGNDTLNGGAGADTLVGGTGDDSYIVDNAGDTVVENTGEGIDTVNASVSHTLSDNVENLTLTGSGNINATGNALDNEIFGNSGANILDGGAGVDMMAGGAGNDTYVVDESTDVVVEQAGGGEDNVLSSVDYTLSDNVEHLTLTGTDAIDGTGNASDNTITGNEANNILSGLAGNDTLVGNGGDDLLNGGVGADVMTGGTGGDTYIVDNEGDVVNEIEGEGTDTVESSISYTLGDTVENLTLTGTEAVDGTGNESGNVLTGNAAANTLSGLEGDDTLAGQGGDDLLDGGLGADAMAGGTGDDTYVVDDAGDVVAELLDEGNDTVESSIDYTLTDNVENLTLTGTEALDGTGNELDNTLTGNSAANTLDGGTGADTMVGGAGNDSYLADNAGDTVVENSGEGTDTVIASVDHTLDDNVENLTLTGTEDLNGTGNALSNVITGNSGTNVLTGGAGNDTYNVDRTDDVVVENVNEGTDTVNSSATYTLSENVENLNLTGSENIDGTGNALNNTINGNSGDNVIDGEAGADTMSGGTGNDTYIVDHTSDRVVEGYNAGTDHVLSSVSHTLSSNVENLTLTGTADINGTGNNLNNVIIGNVGNNIINGGSGADAMAGGEGNDTYTVDNSGDTVSENAGEGIDTVNSSVSHTLSDNVENLNLTGSSSISGTGNDLDNVIVGNSGHNTLSGRDGNDRLTGNSGNDILDGGTGADSMAGGSGNDTYVVDNDGDLVTEGYGQGTDTVNSSITYNLTDNVENLNLTGAAAIDGVGNNLNNVINGNSADNVIDGAAGNDTLNAGSGDDTLIGGDGNDTLNGEAGNDALYGNAGNDLLNGGTGADAMAGGTGNDTYIVDNAGDLVTENPGEGTDLVNSSITYTLTDNVENLTLTGSANIDGTGNEINNIVTGNNGANVMDGQAGHDTLYGNAGNDTISGGDGNDLLNGGTGADAMDGGTGDDTYIVDNAGDTVAENTGEGLDTVNSSVSNTLSDNVENLNLTGSASINGTGNDLDNVMVGNSGHNILSGQDGNDTLTGNSGNDTLYGGSGDDTLTSNAGNDLLDGGTGADVMAGGTGDDTYVVDHDGDIVTEAAGQGTDHVKADITYTLTNNVENLTLTGTEAIDGTGNVLNNQIVGNSADNVLDGAAGNDTLHAGSGDDSLIGGDGNDTLNGEAGNDALFGNAGDDMLNGGTGADSMAGGSGNDTYIVDNAGDLVTENSGEGTDLVNSSIDYTLTDNVENLTLTGSANIDGTGNEINNIVTGNSGANVMDGLAGNDTLYGNAGNDTLYGGEGNDLLDGGSGADAMAGGTGDDTYIVDNAGDTVAENAGEGLDTVNSSVSHTLSDNIENLNLTGSSSINGIGNDLDNVIIGNAGNNTLSGLDGNDTLTGNSGNDVLNGGSGADTMAGGAGNDTYVVDAEGDVVIEAVNAGTDTVQSSIDYTLTNNVENLTLTGSADINGTGNSLNNLITGNSGANILDGGSGVDTLAGGEGDDTYMIDNSSDVVVEAVDGGTDTVYSSANYTLSGNIENLTLIGSAALSGTGNAVDNVITGNTGNNTLSGEGGHDILLGGAGNDALNGGSGADQLFGEAGNDTLNGGSDADVMVGGTGDDTYVVDNASDVVTEAAGEGNDTVQTTIDYSLGDNVENLTLTGSAALSGTGNELDNVIAGNGNANVLNGQEGHDTLIGNGGDDTLDGGSGADLMQGGTGNDTYLVDDVNDTVVELAGGGFDSVLTGLNYVLPEHVEKLMLSGHVDVSGTGNSLANTIIGNDGANTLDGGSGADTLAGGAGDDTYIVDHAGDTVVEAAGEGTDTVQASASHTLEANVENLLLTGNAAISGTGNELDNVITGNSAANVLAGEGGNDTLDGGFGADIMAGGTGDDTYIVDNAGDTVTEAAGEGLDTVYSSVSQTLAANVENLVLTGTANTNGVGNNLSNSLVGSAGDNILSGGGGNDQLEGGLGSDTLSGGAGDDHYIFRPGDGNDTIVDALGNNSMYVGGGLTEFDLEADRVGDDMLVRVLGSTESFLLSDWFAQSASDGLNVMTFDDGTVLDRDGIELLINRPPVANTDYITTYEDGGSLNFPASTLLANDTDPNPDDILTVLSVGESGVGASVFLVDGEVSYDIGDQFQELAQGEGLKDSFSYTISDDKAAQNTGTVEVEIIGVNDAPVVMADEGQTVEDLMTSTSGNVLENDTDIDNGTVLTVADHGNQVGEYGTLSVAADGKYTYALDNEDAVVQTLGRSHEKTETFAYSATDGIVDVASTLSIQVNGGNDAPILVAPLADQDFTFHKPFEWQMPADSFVDIDQGDVLDYSATLADGSPLPDWISFDPTTQTFSGWTPKMVGSIDICVTATDRVESTGSTEGSLSASDVFTFSISHSNQGVGNGEDAAPPGQDTNFNDGPGTSPGGPGAKDKKTAVAAKTTVTYLDLSQVNTLMGTSAVQPVATAEGEIFAGWQNMQAAVNDDSLLYDKGAWSDDRQGADVSSMNKAMSGLLSSTQPFGLDGSELTPSNSTLLKVNNGKKS
ncbi:hypothetical protein DSOUD_2128 [Desulfuromonas soudanensis]|uniref:Dystroglycan-type cadherin-like domain-containing protein n=1 Tax=Desulfuromonas soudanensis TaxID=1603606 RepID=A0A0M4DIT7_9BACT|nr:calcium-binding protein [Desulfuromonas soudanensis]ALC16895.1 hypothetical protein DSOUD_2128 [Desulfuromonas soudanensis]